MTKFDKEILATTGFLKERSVFGPAEVVIYGPAEVVMVSLGPAEVVMIVNNTRYDGSRVFTESSQSLRRDNKVDDIDEHRHFGLIT